MCKFMLDTGNDSSNLMPIRMYKILFLHTNINDLNKSINRKIVLHTYNNLCIPQMAHNAVINKGIEYQCSFFVGARKWTNITGDATL